MSFNLLNHQVQSMEDILEAIEQHRAVVISAPAGTGKTYAVVRAIKLAQEKGLIPTNSTKVASILFLCPGTAIKQQEKVFIADNVKDFHVTSYDAMRSSFGSLMIDWVPTTNRFSKLTHTPIWIDDQYPDIVICDECQFLKNANSQRGEVIAAYIRQMTKEKGRIIFISYTPFQKVIEAKIVALGTGLCKENTFLDWAYEMANSCDLTENSPTATSRVKKALVAKNAWVTFHNVYWKYKAKIKTRLIEFTNIKQKEIYESAYRDYLTKLYSEGKSGPSGVAEIFVALQKFCQCAELLKASQIGAYAKLISTTKKRQIIVAANYVETLRVVWQVLVDSGVDKNKIGYLTGNISSENRQKYIEGFQTGTIDYLLITIKLGGTSLSLHHEQLSARPRSVIMPLCWSGYDMAQLLGRAHRITSLSDTEQDIIGYKDTVEGDRVLPRLDSKLKCLRELLNRSESFILDILNSGVNDIKQAELKKVINENKDEDEDEIDENMIKIEEDNNEYKLINI